MHVQVSDLILDQFTRNLVALDEILKKAKSFAAERKFDENNFMQMRLAPDMLPFPRQVQIATDAAKGLVGRLSGKTVPSFADDEKTMDELSRRIQKTVQLLREFKAEDFKGFADRPQTTPWSEGKSMDGDDFLLSMGLPNFYFHITMAYAILRNNGVPLGKNDFLGNVPWK